MKKLDIVYQDKDIIVVNKDAHLLTIGTEKERDNTLYHKVLMYEKTKRKSNKIFIVHRLDKETSGLVLLAKREEIKDILQNNWDIYAIERKYVKYVVQGLAQGKCSVNVGTLQRIQFGSPFPLLKSFPCSLLKVRFCSMVEYKFVSNWILPRLASYHLAHVILF